mgnify:CR=1 FL=1
MPISTRILRDTKEVEVLLSNADLLALLSIDEGYTIIVMFLERYEEQLVWVIKARQTHEFINTDGHTVARKAKGK